MLSIALIALLSAQASPDQAAPSEQTESAPPPAAQSTEPALADQPKPAESSAPTPDSVLPFEVERAVKTGSRSTAGVFVQNRFNPDLSLITDVAFVRSNLAEDTAGALSMPGLLDEVEMEGKGRGFNFNYLEVALSAAVDPYFDFVGIIALTPEAVHVEETYVDTRHLPFGFRLRLGKFLSAFGRLNGMHHHMWDFYDTPLVYEAFIGLEGFKNPGVRLSWTAPLDFLLQLNLEVFQGHSHEPRLFNASRYELTAQDGTVLSSSHPTVPSMAVGSLKTSFDTGDHVFLAGASVMYGHALQTRIAGESGDWAFNAPGTILYGGELTYKYLISSYRSVTWQSEYLGIVSSGDLAQASDGLVHSARKRQGGFYSQLLWRFDDPGRWRVGTRFDLLVQNSFTVDGDKQPGGDMLSRYTGMLEYSPTEFSRFRLQYAHDRSRFLDGERKNVHEVILQMNIAVGPHGAHTF